MNTLTVTSRPHDQAQEDGDSVVVEGEAPSGERYVTCLRIRETNESGIGEMEIDPTVDLRVQASGPPRTGQCLHDRVQRHGLVEVVDVVTVVVDVVVVLNDVLVVVELVVAVESATVSTAHPVTIAVAEPRFPATASLTILPKGHQLARQSARSVSGWHKQRRISSDSRNFAVVLGLVVVALALGVAVSQTAPIAFGLAILSSQAATTDATPALRAEGWIDES